MSHMAPDLAQYLPGALEILGHLTIVIAPVELYEAVYDRATHVLRIDPSADVAATIAAMLADIVDGPVERQFVSLAGGGAATAAALIPRQAEDEHEREGARLRLVTECGEPANL